MPDTFISPASNSSPGINIKSTMHKNAQIEFLCHNRRKSSHQIKRKTYCSLKTQDALRNPVKCLVLFNFVQRELPRLQSMRVLP